MTPAVTILTGALVVYYVGPGVAKFMEAFGAFIMYATELQPFYMGIIVSVVVGIALTLPISSAALCMMIGLSGLAAGASTVGCSAQMVGFAVMSFKENGWGGLVAQGLGTSMLQIGNIVKKLENMDTSYVSFSYIRTSINSNIEISKYTNSSRNGNKWISWTIWNSFYYGRTGKGRSIPLCRNFLAHLILPAILTLVIASFMRKKNWIKDGDLKLDL